MEEVLRSAPMDSVKKLYQAAFTAEDLRIFPIRHHSPACCYHLQKTIQTFQPECILVEGPSDANDLIPYLIHEESEPPLAIYISYKDSSRYIQEEVQEYKCYYPFLECSPEYVALRTGKGYFIDMPYSEMVISLGTDIGDDEGMMAESRYIQGLCERTGMRNYEEFWEKYFELLGLRQSSEEFVYNLLTDCYMSRRMTADEVLLREGCVLREQFMAKKIEEALEGNNRVLVVTGGFHVPGLLYCLGRWDEEMPQVRWQPHGVPAEDTGIYIMAYSEEAADSLRGYASGMPYPAFYRTAYEALRDKDPDPYENTVRDMLIACGKRVRRKDGGVSAYDEIMALEMCQGLAALRGKPEAGVYELWDGVQSCFIKGELNGVSGMPLVELKKLLSGRKRGRLASGAPVAPIVQDFEKQCGYYRLHIGTSARREVVLEPFSKERHLQESFFLRRMEYLGTEFARMKKGPNIRSGYGLNRIRELWEYRFHPEVIHALIDRSVYGATVEEAAERQLKLQIARSKGCGELSELLLRALEMGYIEELRKGLAILEEKVAEEPSFLELSGCLEHMLFALERGEFYKVKDVSVVVGLIQRTYEKMALLLPGLKKDEDGQVTRSLKTMYQAVYRPELRLDREILREGLKTLAGKDGTEPVIRGASYGILYGFSKEYMAEIVRTGRGYVRGSGKSKSMAAPFLRGVFYTGKDAMLNGTELIMMLNELLYQLSEEDFVDILPELRMAFGYFTPSETEEIGSRVAELFGRKERDLRAGGVPASLYNYAERLDRRLRERMEGGDEQWMESVTETSGTDGG